MRPKALLVTSMLLIGRDTCLRTTFATLQLTSGQSIDASGPWYDAEEGCYIDEPTSRLGSCERQCTPLPFTQEQPQIFPQSSQPLQDQINQQGIDYITQSKNIRVRIEEPRDATRLDASDEGEKGGFGDATSGGERREREQDEEKEDVIGAWRRQRYTTAGA